MHVVYIAGWGRSGSTLLAALLGGFGGVFTAGEARSFWRAMLERWPCACGEPVPDCDVWAGPAAAAPSWPMASAELARFQSDHLRTRHYITAWPRLRVGAPSRDERRYASTYVGLLHSLGETSGANVVVDNSKYPLDVHLLSRLADVDLRVVHLVRDPRAVAHSWATPKALSPDPDAGQLRTFRPLSSSAIWTTWNAMVERLPRHVPVHTVRYEDFNRDPAGMLADIAQFADIPLDRTVGSSNLQLAPNHMVAGNAVRFESGPVSIVEDERWKTSMKAAHRVEALLPALPLLRRYGYPLRSKHTGSR